LELLRQAYKLCGSLFGEILRFGRNMFQIVVCF
jgi:hypothetical protein